MKKQIAAATARPEPLEAFFGGVFALLLDAEALFGGLFLAPPLPEGLFFEPELDFFLDVLEAMDSPQTKMETIIVITPTPAQ